MQGPQRRRSGAPSAERIAARRPTASAHLTAAERSILDFQRQAGNHAVGEALAVSRSATEQGPMCSACSALPVQRIFGDLAKRLRGWRGGSGGTGTTPQTGGAQPAVPQTEAAARQSEYEDARKARNAYIAKGFRGPKNIRPPTGLGGFRASYSPLARMLTILLAGGVSFVDGLNFDGRVATAVHPKAGPAATRINRLRRSQRAAAVAAFQWDGGEKTTFLNGFRDRVQEAWGGQHAFHCTRPYWQDLGADVRVQVHVHDGPKAADEHMSMTTYKVPDNFVGGVGVVNSGAGGATDNSMVVNSNDIAPRRDNLLQYSAHFGDGKTRLGPSNRGTVTAIANTFRSGGQACRTCGQSIGPSGGAVLTVHVKGQGDRPERTARRRYDHIVGLLAAAGFQDPASRLQFVYGGVGTTARFVGGNGLAQNVAVHEAGHMFGLGDEYAVQPGSMISGTGAAAGTAARHDQLAKDMGLPGAVHENNDGIMSIGNVVREQHYATFHNALKEISEVEEWALGPPERVIPPGQSPPGDYPLPDPGATTAIA